MFIKFLHVLTSALWLGTAATLPFWGNRMNRADNLDMVLGISDTVFAIKIFFIMGGLILTLGSGIYLTSASGYGYFEFDQSGAWLGLSQSLYVMIFINSFAILYLMVKGRAGRRSFFRYVPPIGYTNIGLISIMFAEMVIKPPMSQQIWYFFLPLALILILDANWVFRLYRRIQLVKSLSPEQYAKRYFGLMEKEDMTNFFRMFHDDVEFHDPFATAPVIGIKNLEKFFQKLGDQFEDIVIRPERILGSGDHILTIWSAKGLTKNGETLHPFSGTNMMHVLNGKIKRVDIFFDPGVLPRVMRIDPAAA